MRGGKDDEKVLSPMFPRLHVNYTEKGGPRAPPRNKMALYEQLSIPSQRYISESASTFPLPPNNTSSSVPSTSSTHGGGLERNLFTPICNSPASPHLAEKLHSYSSSGLKLATATASHEGKMRKARNYQSLNNGGPMPSTTRCDLFRLYNFSNFKNFSWKKLGDADDLKVPTFTQSGIGPHYSSQQFKDCEKVPQVNLSLSQQLQAPSDIQMKGTGTTDMKSRDYVRNRDEKDARESHSCQDPPEGSASVLSARNKLLVDASSSSLTKLKNSKLLKRSHASLNEQNRSSVDVLNSLNRTNAQLNHECVSTQDNMVFRENLLVESAVDTGKENASKVRIESCSRKPLGDHNGSLNGPETEHKCRKDKKCASVRVGGLERHDDVSDSSMVDSISALDTSPDDVVGVIGEKLFWKARRTIVNQQRVFSVQVFELHRVIKVQKLIAGSPNLLLEDNLYMSKPTLNFPVKKFPSVLEPVPIIKPLSTECADENAVAKLPLPSVNKDTSRGLISHRSNLRSYSGGIASTPVATNTKPSPWCFPIPGNQWLVPVMSPSEGLVYKPYTGPRPPTAGFMAPIYGSCSPVGLTPGCGEFLNTAFGVPASQQGIGIPLMGQTYFPPYGMPVMKPSISSSAVEQMSPFTGGQSKSNQLSIGEINFTAPHRSSCSMSNQLSRVIPSYVEELQASKESEIQGSTVSSPSEKAKGYVLPLFPTEPTLQALHQNAQTGEQQRRVIKVVPHNPRSTTESAARIFRSIQEERKLYD